MKFTGSNTVQPHHNQRHSSDGYGRLIQIASSIIMTSLYRVLNGVLYTDKCFKLYGEGTKTNIITFIALTL